MLKQVGVLADGGQADRVFPAALAFAARQEQLKVGLVLVAPPKPVETKKIKY